MEIISKAEMNSLRRIVGEVDPSASQRRQTYLAIVGPLLSSLAAIGYDVQVVGDLRRLRKPWKSALPLLIQWLPKVEDPAIKEEIVRCLSVPWVKTAVTAELIQQFRKYAPLLKKLPNPWDGNRLSEIDVESKRLAPYFSLAWAIGNAISIVGYKGFEDDILDLCVNKEYGNARQMIVEGLGRIGRSKDETALISLLGDDSVKLHAIRALRKMKSRSALPSLSGLLSDPSAIVRSEARKAINAISK